MTILLVKLIIIIIFSSITRDPVICYHVIARAAYMRPNFLLCSFHFCAFSRRTKEGTSGARYGRPGDSSYSPRSCHSTNFARLFRKPVCSTTSKLAYRRSAVVATPRRMDHGRMPKLAHWSLRRTQSKQHLTCCTE